MTEGGREMKEEGRKEGREGGREGGRKEAQGTQRIAKRAMLGSTGLRPHKGGGL